jgi:hypothetical protein
MGAWEYIRDAALKFNGGRCECCGKDRMELAEELEVTCLITKDISSSTERICVDHFDQSCVNEKQYQGFSLPVISEDPAVIFFVSLRS